MKALLAILLTSLALAAVALRPPTPVPAGAPAAEFSARRAFADVQAIAQRPHPTGSPEAARVRAYLVSRLAAMGLAPSVRPGPYANIVAVLPGRDHAAPALALMAHSDSVAAGPGAGDDAAGVASVLEIVRALKAAGPHRRDVMVVITDGEEPGLLGAKAFFGSDPLAARPGIVINMEARGNRGRAAMFETQPQAGALIALLRRRGALTGASSLMPDLYHRLPNDTDLTIAIKAGRQGLNFAIFGGQSAYHTALDTPANLDLGGLQHMGDQGLAAALVLADLDALPAPAPDGVYGDLLGGPVLAYPAPAGWAAIAAAALLIVYAAARAVRARTVSLLQLIRGATGFVLVFLIPALALTLAGRGVAAGPLDLHGLLQRYPWLLAGYGLVAVGAALLTLAALTRARGPWRAASPTALSVGSLVVVTAAAAALQVAAPLDAFMLAWPALAGAVALALPAGRVWRWPAVLVAVLALAQVIYWAGLLFSLSGVALPMMLAVFAAVGAAVVMPWAAPAAQGRAGLALGAAAALGGAVILALASTLSV